MEFKLQFNMDNAAFQEEFQDFNASEVARILSDIRYEIREGLINAAISDLNGNTIGQWSIINRYDKKTQ